MLLGIGCEIPNNLESNQTIPSKPLIAAKIHGHLDPNFLRNRNCLVDVIITEENRLSKRSASTNGTRQKSSFLNKTSRVVLTNFSGKDILCKAVGIFTNINPSTSTSIRVHP